MIGAVHVYTKEIGSVIYNAAVPLTAAELYGGNVRLQLHWWDQQRLVRDHPLGSHRADTPGLHVVKPALKPTS